MSGCNLLAVLMGVVLQEREAVHMASAKPVPVIPVPQARSLTSDLPWIHTNKYTGKLKLNWKWCRFPSMKIGIDKKLSHSKCYSTWALKHASLPNLENPGKWSKRIVQEHSLPGGPYRFHAASTDTLHTGVQEKKQQTWWLLIKREKCTAKSTVFTLLFQTFGWERFFSVFQSLLYLPMIKNQ